MKSAIKRVVLRFVREQAGQDLIEYALLAAFISLVCLALVITTGTDLSALYAQIDTMIKSASAGGS